MPRFVFLNRGVLLRAVKVALVVGCVLVAINHGDALLAGNIDGTLMVKAALTFLVPFSVSVYSSAAAIRNPYQQPSGGNTPC